MQVECDYSQNRALLLSAFQVTHGHFLQQNTRFASEEFLLFCVLPRGSQRGKYKVSCRDADNARRGISGSWHQESHVSARFIDFREWWRIFYYLRLKKCSLAVGVMNESRSVAQQPDQQLSHKYEIGFAFMMCLIF
jgi:hypothetical protein